MSLILLFDSGFVFQHILIYIEFSAKSSSEFVMAYSVLNARTQCFIEAMYNLVYSSLCDFESHLYQMRCASSCFTVSAWYFPSHIYIFPSIYIQVVSLPHLSPVSPSIAPTGSIIIIADARIHVISIQIAY